MALDWVRDPEGLLGTVVGGFAVNFYGYIRTTQDIDILVNPSPENAERVIGVLPCAPMKIFVAVLA